MILKGTRESEEAKGQRRRKNGILLLLLKGFYGVVAEVRGRHSARDNKGRQDKSTAALSPSERERPVVLS